jgi:hypothetical protein
LATYAGRNSGRYSATGDGLIGMDTVRLEETDQDVDKNREQCRHEREQQAARRAAIDANATAGERLRAKRIMRFHWTDSPIRPTCKRGPGAQVGPGRLPWLQASLQLVMYSPEWAQSIFSRSSPASARPPTRGARVKPPRHC